MAENIVNVRVQNKYDTEANWKAKDPVLLKGEVAFTSDGNNAGKHKVGNGTSKWSVLQYSKAYLTSGDVTTALGYTPPKADTWRNVVNNLTTDSTSESLSATQGKVLKGLVDSKADKSHTHNYAGSSSSGGAANSALKISAQTPILAVGNESNDISVKQNANGTFAKRTFKLDMGISVNGKIIKVGNRSLMVAKPTSTSSNYALKNAIDFKYYSSHWQIGNVRSRNNESIGFGFSYSDDGTSWYPKAILTTSGQLSVDIVQAKRFEGTLYGNATSASSVPWSGITGKPGSMPASDVYAWAKASTKPSYSWSEVTGKPTTFTPATHTHSYLPLSGGTLSGSIQMNNNGISIDTNGAMIYGSNTSGNIYFRYKKAFSDKDYAYTNLHSIVTAINGKMSLTGGTLNNGSTQCPLIITGCANNESSITFKYKTQTSGGHWVIGEGCGTADLNTFAFYQNGKGVLAKLKNDGQWVCGKTDLTYCYTNVSLVPGPDDGAIKFSGETAWGIVKSPNALQFVNTKSVKFRMQDTYCYCDVGFQSQGIFDTTTSNASNMRIENNIVKRVSSASKYKLDIQNINEDSSYCYNLLRLNPRQWFDKGEIERYSEYLTAEYNNEDISDEFKKTVNSGSLNPYYGLVAEDLEAAGLEKFCDYGAEKDDGTKELEGIQYDRVPILMIPILRDLVTCMQKILPSIEENISDTTLLSEIKEVESRFNSFNSQNIINKKYVNK